jgi:hypothetical protein
MHPLPSLLAILVLLGAAPLGAADPQLVLDVTLVDGGGDAPMIVVWVEKADGTFVRTLHMFSKDKKYYKDMLVWSAAREGGAEDAKALDAVIGATPAWSSHQVVKVPAKGLLGGDLVLRVEQRKDKGGHYKKRKVPITANWPGVTLEKEGYLASMVITVEK